MSFHFVSSLLVAIVLIGPVVGSSSAAEPASQGPVKFARFKVGDQTMFGIVEGDTVRKIDGSIFGKWQPTDETHKLSEVMLLVPTHARQVFALAGNYKSHLNQTEIPAKFQIPQPFLKPPSSLLRDQGKIVLPGDATEEVHYEAELVIVIGKRARQVSKEDALDYVLGVTCGNDVSERFWQNDAEHKDVQWWRAKGADTFGPCGPFIATGINYDDLLITLRLNGKVVQQERTSQMIHDVASQVSFISRYVTLLPGDLIFTGTSGTTSALHSGDEVEVEIEGVGVLRNRVVRAKPSP